MAQIMAIGVMLGVMFVCARFAYVLLSVVFNFLEIRYYKTRIWLRRNRVSDLSMPTIEIPQKVIFYGTIVKWLVIASVMSWLLFAMFLPLIATIGIL